MKLRIKLEKITASIKFIKEKLAEFLNRNYILNSGFQLLSDPKFSSARGQSFIYCLGEWYNIWAKNIFGIIQVLSSQTLYQQAKHCEQIKNNLIPLQEFYDQYKHSASPNKKFLREFDKQVIDTISEVKNALERNPSLDVGRYILERTNQLIGLMGVQLSRRSDIFYIASIRQRLERLNEVRKPDLAAPQRMEESISSFVSP
ncbi:hypothetical protein [Legionella bozemanae]|uniref:hypothetical protein n=1 Tax=Legionella bozemanae TaxID=447 RepID=UPI00399C88AC